MLNKTEGEPLGALGRGAVVPTEKWADILGFYEIASEAATIEFVKVGAQRPIKFGPDDVLVQEYHLQGLIVFLFCHRVSGIDHYYWYKFTLSETILTELILLGKWPAAMLPGLHSTVH